MCSQSAGVGYMLNESYGRKLLCLNVAKTVSHIARESDSKTIPNTITEAST